MEYDEIPYSWITMEAINRASAKGIELSANPFNLIFRHTPRGHYLHFSLPRSAEIMAVDDYRSAPGIYDDILPGFVRINVESPEVPEAPDEAKRFVRIDYEHDAALFERTVLEPLRPK